MGTNRDLEAGYSHRVVFLDKTFYPLAVPFSTKEYKWIMGTGELLGQPNKNAGGNL